MQNRVVVSSHRGLGAQVDFGGAWRPSAEADSLHFLVHFLVCPPLAMSSTAPVPSPGSARPAPSRSSA